MFNLEQSISTWRTQMLAVGIHAPVPLEELESHLRDDIEQLIKSGSTESEAFDTALARIGHAGPLNVEFRKVAESKPIHQQKMFWILLGAAFIGCGIAFGQSIQLTVVYSLFLAGLLVASFVDFRKFIIPDSLTLGGVAAGLLCSLLLPQLQGQKLPAAAMTQSLLGIGIGAGLLYFILRLGKLLLGQQRFPLAADAKVVFTGSSVLLPDKSIPYTELFYRSSDAITLHARSVKIPGRSWQDVPVRFTRDRLQIGNDHFNPGEVQQLEATSGEIILPRETMGLGDVKFMAAIGAFLGWPAVIFSLIVSSLLGSCVGLGLSAAQRREISDRIPYGPFLALAAAIWIFCGKQLLALFLTP